MSAEQGVFFKKNGGEGGEGVMRVNFFAKKAPGNGLRQEADLAVTPYTARCAGSWGYPHTWASGRRPIYSLFFVPEDFVYFGDAIFHKQFTEFVGK